MQPDSLQMARQSFIIESQAIADTLAAMDFTAFAEAVAVLSRCSRIATSGCGHSGIACRHFAHSLCCIERPARFIAPSEAVHGGMGFVQAGDAVVLASRGGKTAELLPILAIARAKRAVVISVTEHADSPLGRESDIVLPMKVVRESDKYDSQSTASFVALTAVFDALQVALIEETGYVNEQFALIHPGGAVGERLNGPRLVDQAAPDVVD